MGDNRAHDCNRACFFFEIKRLNKNSKTTDTKKLAEFRYFYNEPNTRLETWLKKQENFRVDFGQISRFSGHSEPSSESGVIF